MRPPEWEYKSLQLDVAGWLAPKVESTEMDLAMNHLGRDGWQLVSVLDLNKGQGMTSSIVLLFKRPRN